MKPSSRKSPMPERAGAADSPAKDSVHYQHPDVEAPLEVFYASKFHEFREKHLEGGNESYLQSLARSSHWDTTGGKSTSVFNRTLDERFVVKTISRVELDKFIASAPAYFDYMDRGFPTVLSKVFGVYRLGNRNMAVMEALFYARKVDRIFDLKGSMRNRLVSKDKIADRKDVVLLDENFVEFIFGSPLLVSEKSKVALITSIFNDTLFLSRLHVMDYSLLVGVNEKEQTLYVGIIDWFRVFSWDKQVCSLPYPFLLSVLLLTSLAATFATLCPLSLHRSSLS